MGRGDDGLCEMLLMSGWGGGRRVEVSLGYVGISRMMNAVFVSLPGGREFHGIALDWSLFL